MSTSEISGPGFPLWGSPPTGEQTAKQFLESDIPVTPLPTPQQCNEELATITTVENTIVNLSQSPNVENIQKRSQLIEKMEFIARFAENHPFLTIGFVIAMILVVATAYLTVQAFLGHTTISILHAHPELGGGLTFMTIYQSINLINMARRASIRDDLESRIVAHNEFVNQFSKIQEGDTNAFLSKINTEITSIHAQFATVARQSEEADQKKYQEMHDEALAIQKRLRGYQAELSQLIIKAAEGSDQKKLLQEALNQVTHALQKGEGQLFVSPAQSLYPIAPLLQPMQLIEIPPHETEMMIENQQAQRPLLEKMEAAFEAIGPFIQNNPGTVAMLIAGMLMCGLSGLAIYFYLQGATKIYFFGTLSLVSLAPMAVYGLNMIYEAYNYAMINQLQTHLKQIKENEQKRTNALQERKAQLAKIQETAQTNRAQFIREWMQFRESTEKENQKKLDSITSKSQEHSNLESYCKGILEVMQTLYPDLPQTAVNETYETLALGAEIAGHS